MKVGFTGTRKGMAPAQLAALRTLLGRLAPSEFHHGDCVGADDEAATLVGAFFEGCRIVAHPSDNPALRADNHSHDEERPPRPYLQRNRDIVGESDCLVAAPETAAEVMRGGTWSTVRSARRARKPVYLVLPDGTVRAEAVYGP
jgi:hypothetical protein